MPFTPVVYKLNDWKAEFSIEIFKKKLAISLEYNDSFKQL